MYKILVTGGAGFIGNHLVKALLNDPLAYVVIMDNMSSIDFSRLPDKNIPNWEFIKGNANKYEDIKSVFQQHSFEYIFHYAAFVGVEQNLKQPVSVFEDLKGIEYLLQFSIKHQVKRFIYASSSEVYGNSPSFPQYEDSTPLNARLPYGAVKATGEAFVRAYQQQFGLPYSIFRFFNVYGSTQRHDFVMQKFLSAALKGENLYIYGDGQQKRTFCFIDDATQTVINAYRNPEAENLIMNVGNSKEYTILQLAQYIQKVTGAKSSIIHKDRIRKEEIFRRLPDNSRMKRFLQRPLTSLEEGIKKMIPSSVYKSTLLPK